MKLHNVQRKFEHMKIGNMEQLYVLTSKQMSSHGPPNKVLTVDVFGALQITTVEDIRCYWIKITNYNIRETLW